MDETRIPAGYLNDLLKLFSAKKQKDPANIAMIACGRTSFFVHLIHFGFNCLAAATCLWAGGWSGPERAQTPAASRVLAGGPAKLPG